MAFLVHRGTILLHHEPHETSQFGNRKACEDSWFMQSHKPKQTFIFLVHAHLYMVWSPVEQFWLLYLNKDIADLEKNVEGKPICSRAGAPFQQEKAEEAGILQLRGGGVQGEITRYGHDPAHKMKFMVKFGHVVVHKLKFMAVLLPQIFTNF